MSQALPNPPVAPPVVPEVLKKLDDAVIAPRPSRRYRAAAFQIFVLVTALVFVLLAVASHFVAYFPIDLTVTRALQSYHGTAFDGLMFVVSWVGFFPQVVPISLSAILALWFMGLRWEATAALVATVSSGVYLYRVSVGSEALRGKMVLLK